MPEYPECPFCTHRLSEHVPETIEGPIRLRCPSCKGLYEYIPQEGSFPLDDDFGITVTKSFLGHRVVSEGTEVGDELSMSRALLIGGMCCCTTVIIIPVVLALFLALLG